ncbi:unnamed protein product [Schistocephalus solidus]|uniref:Uncharacterized protein n=1 Tax=Schistocephalus solidus TaxID=70667 RepID=A0A183T4R9_SCHSO|nr:unnamed protein product [Schistocephalus solidus]
MTPNTITCDERGNRYSRQRRRRTATAGQRHDNCMTTARQTIITAPVLHPGAVTGKAGVSETSDKESSGSSDRVSFFAASPHALTLSHLR